MSVKVFPASMETEYPVRLSAGIQQTSESLNPTTTLLPEAATLVSLCVFCGDALSSAKQFTCTLPVALGSAAHTAPWCDVAFKLPFRSLTTRSPLASIRGFLVQSGFVAAVRALVKTLPVKSESVSTTATGRMVLNSFLICPSLVILWSIADGLGVAEPDRTVTFQSFNRGSEQLLPAKPDSHAASSARPVRATPAPPTFLLSRASRSRPAGLPSIPRAATTASRAPDCPSRSTSPSASIRPPPRTH